MEKEAITIFNVHPLLKRRWSPRAFSDRAIEKEKVQRMFEAARWAPSSMNEQPWRFIMGLKGDSTYEVIFSSLVEFNRLWAGTAPMLTISCGKMIHSGKNEGKPNESFAYDVGQSLAHLTFQAMSDGLFVHQMGGFDKESLQESFKIPDQYSPLTVFAAGYPGDPGVLHPNLRKMEYGDRIRKDFHSFVFMGEFGKSSDFFNEV
ncbi:MAG: nitroreductase family protein [Bacteroidales bacterium]|nr:nitroreductase family protein [Bacteroidales bacterium]